MNTQNAHMPVMIDISSIKIDKEIQPRSQISEAVVTEYAESMTQGATFPPVIVFYDGSNFWLADGFHRIAAKQANGDLEILTERKFGSRRDAVLFAAGANATHGLRRTNADKRRVVERLLKDPEWCQWSDNAIAHQCGVSNTFVGKIRQQHHSSFNGCKMKTRKGENGNLINISNIGKGRRDSKPIKGSKLSTATVRYISQPTHKSGTHQDQLVNQYIKQVKFPLNFNGEQFKIEGTITHLLIEWQHDNQSGCVQVPINQVIFLGGQSVGQE